jgi:hypothetical protein
VIEKFSDSKLSISRKIEKVLRFGLKMKILTVYNYKDAFKYFINSIEDSLENVFPTIMPNWDHSPRSGKNAWILHNSTPELFAQNVKDALKCTEFKKAENKIIFLKSWNEWGEGNYIEPDIVFKNKYLKSLEETLYNYYQIK